MTDIVKALYNCAFTIWNTLIELAMTLFTTSPKTAGAGSPYQTVHSLYNAISDATVPIFHQLLPIMRMMRKNLLLVGIALHFLMLVHRIPWEHHPQKIYILF